jgi:hypothetical protein
MNTNRTSIVFALLVIAFLSIMLSACNPVDLMNASYATDAPVSSMAVANSSRISACSISDRTLILGLIAIEGEGHTTSSFLSALSAKFSCIQ